MVDATLSPVADDSVYTQLLPVLVQCFVIIIFGYIAGRTRLIGENESKGIHLFVTFFLLPALIFKSLATIDFSVVNWMFLLGVGLGKATIFISVALFTLILMPAKHKCVSYAGLYAIFATMSNDFALGYPLVNLLYSKTHSEFPHYLYLISPIQLTFLNPIGFLMMELGRNSGGGDTGSSDVSVVAVPSLFWVRLRRTLLGVVKNPVVIMTALGVLWNVVWGATLPVLLDQVLTPLAQAFSACALFLLGLNMTGRFSGMDKYGLLIAVLLVCAKIIASPLIIRETLNHLNVADNRTDLREFSDFGFLYGMLPTAPTVLIFAAQYGLCGDGVTTGIVAGTFFSAPFIFLSATMTRLGAAVDYHTTFTRVIGWIGLAGVVCGVWTLIVLMRKFSRVTHGTTAILCGAQLVTAVGGSMLLLKPNTFANEETFMYIQTIVSLGGVFAARIWTAMLAVVLTLINCRSLCFVLRFRRSLFVFGLGSSVIATIILAAGVPEASEKEDSDPNFQLGRLQAAVSLVFLVISLVATIGGLVFQQRLRNRTRGYTSLSTETDTEDEPVVPVQTAIPARRRNVSTCENCSCGGRDSEPIAPTSQEMPALTLVIPDLEDLRSRKASINCDTGDIKRKARVRRTSSRHVSESAGCGDANVLITAAGPSHHDELQCGIEANCTPHQRKECSHILQSYFRDIEERIEDVELQQDVHDMFRHIVLLLLLCCSMMIGLAVCLWQLLTDVPSGILVELEFIDIVMNYGQCILTFVVFGLEFNFVVAPLCRIYRMVRYGHGGEIVLPTEISSETRHICDQFRTYHLSSCLNDIGSSREFRGRVYSPAFSGQELIDWLVTVGLAKSRQEGVDYGRALVDGRVIRHVINARHFDDRLCLYTLLPVGDGVRLIQS